METSYVQTFGSFVRNGKYTLEADYIFNSVEDLKQWEQDNKKYLHEGLLKVVINNDKQILYWYYNDTFVPLAESDSLENLKTILEDFELHGKLRDIITDFKNSYESKLKAIQQELDNTQVGAGLNGDGSYDSINMKNTTYLEGSKSITEALKALDRELLNISNNAIIKDAYYDSTNECVVLVFNTSEEGEKTLKINIANLIREWEPNNTQDTKVVVLERQEIYGEGPDKVSADVRISTKADNILQKDNNSLYVKGTSDQIQYNEQKLDTVLNNIIDNQEALNKITPYYIKYYIKKVDGSWKYVPEISSIDQSYTILEGVNWGTCVYLQIYADTNYLADFTNAPESNENTTYELLEQVDFPLLRNGAKVTEVQYKLNESGDLEPLTIELQRTQVGVITANRTNRHISADQCTSSKTFLKDPMNVISYDSIDTLSYEDRATAGKVFINQDKLISKNNIIYGVPEYNNYNYERFLTCNNNTLLWKRLDSLSLEQLQSYGVKWNKNHADPHLTRIGNMTMHQSLPVQSLLKGCLVKGNQIVRWLNPSDWNQPETDVEVTGGTLKLIYKASTKNLYIEFTNPIFDSQKYIGVYFWLFDFDTNAYDAQVIKIDESTTTATLIYPNQDIKQTVIENYIDDPLVDQTISIEEDVFALAGELLNGYDGVVKIYCPEFYIKSTESNNEYSVSISLTNIDSTWTKQPEILVDAYKCTTLQTVPENMGYLSTLQVGSAVSIVNPSTYCRGGLKRESYDKYLYGSDDSGEYEIASYKTDLCKPLSDQPLSYFRGWARKSNSELLTYNQYKNIFYWLYVIEYANFNCQEEYNESLTELGYRQGGLGQGVIPSKTVHGNYNYYCLLTPCGYGNSLGNNTGLVPMTIPNFTSTDSETFYVPRWRGFDNIFGEGTLLEGILVNNSSTDNTVYITDNPNNFSSSIQDKTPVGNIPLESGFIKHFNLGNTAEIIPSEVGASTTTYKCDYLRRESAYEKVKIVLVGYILSTQGSNSGIGSFDITLNTDNSNKYSGCRTTVLL